MKKAPKILLSCPTSYHKDYCFDAWSKSVKALTFPNLDIQLHDNSKNKDHALKLGKTFSTSHLPIEDNEEIREVMTRCQNEMRDKVLNEGYDYLFSLESDIFPPDNIIEHLLKFKKRIVSAGYFVGLGFESKPMVFETQDFGIYRISKPMSIEKAFLFFDGKLKKAYQTGLGCCLIHRSILEKVSFRIEKDDPAKSHSDTYFHDDLRKLGIPVYLDTSVICHHQNKNWNRLKTQ